MTTPGSGTPGIPPILTPMICPIIPLFPIRARAYNDMDPLSGAPQNQHQMDPRFDAVFNSTRIRIQKGSIFNGILINGVKNTPFWTDFG